MADRVKLTEAQRRILIEARDHGSVEAYSQRRRSCEQLRDAGLLKKCGLQTMEITPAGRALLASDGRKGE
jgi:hypothetical protein